MKKDKELYKYNRVKLTRKGYYEFTTYICSVNKKGKIWYLKIITFKNFFFPMYFI